jgi:hypothetical protein
MNPLIAALFGQNQGLDITGALKQQGQNQLNAVNAFGGLMQQAPGSKIAQSNNNSARWGSGLDGWYQKNTMARPGEYDPMGTQAERRRQVQYGTQDTQDRNRLLQEQLWGNFLGKTNDMLSGGRGQGGFQQQGQPQVQENNSPGQGGMGGLQGQMDQLMRMLAPAMEPQVSLDGFQPSPGQGRLPTPASGVGASQQPQAPQPQPQPNLTGQGVGAMPDPYASRSEDPAIASAFRGSRKQKPVRGTPTVQNSQLPQGNLNATMFGPELPPMQGPVNQPFSWVNSQAGAPLNWPGVGSTGMPNLQPSNQDFGSYEPFNNVSWEEGEIGPINYGVSPLAMVNPPMFNSAVGVSGQPGRGQGGLVGEMGQGAAMASGDALMTLYQLYNKLFRNSDSIVQSPLR